MVIMSLPLCIMIEVGWAANVQSAAFTLIFSVISPSINLGRRPQRYPNALIGDSSIAVPYDRIFSMSVTVAENI